MALQSKPFPPVGNSFTTGAAVQLGHETGHPASDSFLCLSVVAESLKNGDTGVAQIDSVLVGFANPDDANTSGNVKFVRNLVPGDSIEIAVASIEQVWVKAASNTPIAKYFTKRGDNF